MYAISEVMTSYPRIYFIVGSLIEERRNMDDAQMAVIMPLIMYGGEAKSSAVEAIRAAKAGDFEKADERITKRN